MNAKSIYVVVKPLTILSATRSRDGEERFVHCDPGDYLALTAARAQSLGGAGQIQLHAEDGRFFGPCKNER